MIEAIISSLLLGVSFTVRCDYKDFDILCDLLRNDLSSYQFRVKIR